MTTKKRTAPSRSARTASGTPKTKTAKKPAPKRCSITFTFFAPNARQVDIAGTFNSWKLKPMKKARDGNWKVNLRPQPGRYEYKFIVDDQWLTDPSNPESVSDEHGNRNSVIELS